MQDAYREDLAYIHHAGFAGSARAAAEVLLEELRRAGFAKGLVIDLGCGSGILSERVAAAGFEVLGVDLSAAFIAEARRRVPKGDFRVGSLLTAELAPCVAVAAVGECVNYLFDPDHSWQNVRLLFQRVFDVLAPRGLFLLDVAGPGRVPGGKARHFVEGDDWVVLVDATEDREGLLTRNITSFRRVGELYRRDSEVHRVRLVPRGEVESWLRDAGFGVESFDGYGALTLAAGHTAFVARK